MTFGARLPCRSFHSPFERALVCAASGEKRAEAAESRNGMKRPKKGAQKRPEAGKGKDSLADGLFLSTEKTLERYTAEGRT